MLDDLCGGEMAGIEAPCQKRATCGSCRRSERRAAAADHGGMRPGSSPVAAVPRFRPLLRGERKSSLVTSRVRLDPKSTCGHSRRVPRRKSKYRECKIKGAGETPAQRSLTCRWFVRLRIP